MMLKRPVLAWSQMILPLHKSAPIRRFVAHNYPCLPLGCYLLMPLLSVIIMAPRYYPPLCSDSKDGVSSPCRHVFPAFQQLSVPVTFAWGRTRMQEGSDTGVDGTRVQWSCKGCALPTRSSPMDITCNSLFPSLA